MSTSCNRPPAEQWLGRYGPNELPAEPPPGVWAVVRGQLTNPVNIMLLMGFAATIILGWTLTLAAAELHLLRRLLDTRTFTGGEWVIVLALSLLVSAVVALDQAMRLSCRRKASAPARPDRERTRIDG